jgi:selenocysteine-specific elongation factor
VQLKERQGNISRIAPDGCSAVCKGLFKKESDISFFEGAKVLTGRGEPGVIQVWQGCQGSASRCLSSSLA